MRHPKRNRFLIGFAIVALLSLTVSGILASPPSARGTELDKVEVTYSDPAAPSHAGPGPDPTSESDAFKLTNGAISWFSTGVPIEYVISDAPSPKAIDAIQRAVATMDGFITTREFQKVNRSDQINPCTGAPNSISWRPGDGPGGELAFAGVCFNPATKEILGFRVILDAYDAWTAAGESDKFDVENVATHEMGHVAGLEHVDAPKDGCLTMYKFSGLGEVQKQTPGLGDKLGLDKLYQSGDAAAGNCGS